MNEVRRIRARKWNNVGVSLFKALRALKDTQVDTVSSLQTMKQLLEKFTEITFKYQKQTDTVFDKSQRRASRRSPC